MDVKIKQMLKDYKDTYKRTADQLISLRKKKGWSRYRAQKETSLSPNSLTKMEKGEEGYHIDSLLIYLDALGVDFPDIVKENYFPTKTKALRR